MDLLEDDIISGCNCGTFGRAHSRTCPMNPRNKQTTLLKIQLKETEEKQATGSTEKGVCKQCGSDTHALPTHHLCPYNKRLHLSGSNENKGAKKRDTDSNSDGDGQTRINAPMTDVESYGDHENYQLPDKHVMPEDDVVSGCNCGASGRARSRTCPMNPRNKQTSFKVQMKETQREDDKQATVGTLKKNTCPYNQKLHTSGSSDNKGAKKQDTDDGKSDLRPWTQCVYTFLADRDSISFVE